MNKKAYLAILLLLLLLSGCGPASSGGSSQPPPPVKKSTNQEFKLKGGQEVRLEAEGLVLRFDAVLEDSRCPKMVTCVWAGQAVILLAVRKEGEAEVEMELSTNLTQKKDAAEYLDYTVQLLKLEPYPNRPEEQYNYRDYTATLVIKK